MIFVTTNDTVYRCFNENDRDNLEKTLNEFKISKSQWNGEVWRVIEIYDDTIADELFNILKDKPYWNNLWFRVFKLKKDYSIRGKEND